jgi:pyruvate/2-oxoglutarate dehydrogenase complex dihydrolipoamide acyltransferase (E2) component
MIINWRKAGTQLLALLKQPPAAATYRTYPKLRNFILDVMAEGRRKNTINLLFEADLTAIRTKIAQYHQPVSITAYIAKSLSDAVAEDKSIQAYRKGKSQLVIFDDVDLSIMVEREIDGHIMPVPLIIRGAHLLSVHAIAQTLNAAKTATIGDTGPMSALERVFFTLPNWLRKPIWLSIRHDPQAFKQFAGTVAITSMGMHAKGATVIIPITPMTLMLSIGGAYTKLLLDNGKLITHEFIQMNLSADHDIIDGAPLMRFAELLKRKLHGTDG